MKIHFGQYVGRYGPDTEFRHIFCAGVSPLQLDVVLVVCCILFLLFIFLSFFFVVVENLQKTTSSKEESSTTLVKPGLDTEDISTMPPKEVNIDMKTTELHLDGYNNIETEEAWIHDEKDAKPVYQGDVEKQDSKTIDSDESQPSTTKDFEKNDIEIKDDSTPQPEKVSDSFQNPDARIEEQENGKYQNYSEKGENELPSKIPEQSDTNFTEYGTMENEVKSELQLEVLQKYDPIPKQTEPPSMTLKQEFDPMQGEVKPQDLEEKTDSMNNQTDQNDEDDFDDKNDFDDEDEYDHIHGDESDETVQFEETDQVFPSENHDMVMEDKNQRLQAPIGDEIPNEKVNLQY